MDNHWLFVVRGIQVTSAYSELYDIITCYDIIIYTAIVYPAIDSFISFAK